MNFEDIKINYIKEEEFLSYLDWLTRFKNPINNLLRVCEKIITKNTVYPKFNIKKYSELSFFEKAALSRYIWEKSLDNLLKNRSEDTKLRDFLIFEEEQTFNTNFLIKQVQDMEFDNKKTITSYQKLREQIFLPIDELINYFESKNISANFFNRLLEKKKSTLNNKELFLAKTNFASTKILFLVEGITEEKILPIFAKKEDFDFEQNGIKLKSAGGKTHLLKYYTDNRNLFKIPIFILLDADGVDILDDLNNILLKKDKVYLISKGEIEDILPHELIIRAINNYYSMQGSITENDLNKNEPMTKILYNLYKEKGFGEFHKAKFAQILQENINSKEDAKGEIEKILSLIQNNCKE